MEIGANKEPTFSSSTKLQNSLENTDKASGEETLPLLYRELRRLADYYMSRQDTNQTLKRTVLVHDAYLRLVEENRAGWRNLAHFLGMAAEMMRRVLVNFATLKGAARLGEEPEKAILDASHPLLRTHYTQVLEIDAAIERLAVFDPSKSRILELKFFGGLTTGEIAQFLNLSLDLVEREWCLSRAWLNRELEGGMKVANQPR